MSNNTIPSQQHELLLQIGAAHDQSDLSSSDDSTQALNAELDSITHELDSESSELHSHQSEADHVEKDRLGNGDALGFRKQGENSEGAPALLELKQAMYGASAMGDVCQFNATQEWGKGADGVAGGDKRSGIPSVDGCSTKAVQGDN